MTEYFECGAYTEKKNIIDVSNKVKFFDNGCVIGKAIDKLAQYEDVMEEHDFNNIEDLQDFLNYAEKILKEYRQVRFDRDIWQKACELACREAPIHCPNPPEYYNAQDEYGSDEPYYIQESACEFSDDAERCLECQINYLYQQAKKENNND